MMARAFLSGLVGEFYFPVSAKGHATPRPSEIGIGKIPPLTKAVRETMMEPGSSGVRAEAISAR
jgi:hypothetical protein